MKVGFFLDNSGLEGIDLSTPLRGNPGVGGTEYLTVAIPLAVQRGLVSDPRPEAAHKVILLATRLGGLPPELEVIQCPGIANAAEICRREGIDALVIRSDDRVEHFRELIESLDKAGVKGIVWAHNMLATSCHNLVSESDCVRALVHVGHEILDYHRDLSSVYKATVISNAVPMAEIRPKLSYDRSLKVVYLGSLTAAKGFDRLARIWPRIRERCSGAELHVIGSGRVYDRSAPLGPMGLAAPDFEDTFMKFLTVEGGRLDPSVTFHGAMGIEKEDLMREAAVGVVNPTGNTETFCLSAVEFEALGVPVVSAAEWGLLDTVFHGRTGFLCNEDDEFVDAIVALLEDPELQGRMGREGASIVREKFGFEQAATRWIELFDLVEQGSVLKVVPPKKNLGYREKWIKEAVRIAKRYVPALRGQPAIESVGRRRAIVRQLRLLCSPRSWMRWLSQGGGG